MDPTPHAVTIDEFIKQVADLWGAVGANHEELPLTSEQRAELDRRLDAYASNLHRAEPSRAAPRIGTINRILHFRRSRPSRD